MLIEIKDVSSLKWRDLYDLSSAYILYDMVVLAVIRSAKENFVIDGRTVYYWEAAATEVPGNATWLVSLRSADGSRIQGLGKADTREEAKLIAEEWYSTHIKM